MKTTPVTKETVTLPRKKPSLRSGNGNGGGCSSCGK